MFVREIEWPQHVALIARSLARTEHWFWFDGEAIEPNGRSGRSYLGTAPKALLATRGQEHDFLQTLRAELGAHHTELPVNLVVSLSYEFGVALLGQTPASDDEAPAFALVPDVVLVLDHTEHSATLHGPSESALDDWMLLHGHAIHASAPITELLQQQGVGTTSAGLPHTSPARWRRDPGQYQAGVQRCKQSIRDGEAYVLCYTDLAEVHAPAIDALDLFLQIRTDGAAIRGAVIVAGSRALVSASPERFLSVAGDHISTSPIKGTRARGATVEADEALAQELAHDPKERAENLMIVDLMRNDFSRVCEPGSVHTEDFLQVETHPRVHQLVSTVRGQLRQGEDIFSAIATCFPGGSMTGAPKLRAVQLLAELEQGPRGLYSGCFGIIGSDRTAQLAMTIRSVELRGYGSLSCRALVGSGGGVTSDSDPSAEFNEKELKAAALLRSLGVH